MNKKQALAQISEHLDILSNYEVINENTAEILFMYITEIIEQIEETDPDTARAKAIDNLVQLWSDIKDKDDDTPN